MSKQSIKQTIDLNIYQNGQQRITGNVMNSVLKSMVDNEYDEIDNVNAKHGEVLRLVASLFEDVVFVRDRAVDVVRLKSMVEEIEGRTFAIGLPFPIRLR